MRNQVADVNCDILYIHYSMARRCICIELSGIVVYSVSHLLIKLQNLLIHLHDLCGLPKIISFYQQTIAPKIGMPPHVECTNSKRLGMNASH